MAFCGKCGRQITDGATFCPYCGGEQPRVVPTTVGAGSSAMPPTTQGFSGQPPQQAPFGQPTQGQPTQGQPPQQAPFGQPTQPGFPGPATQGGYGAAGPRPALLKPAFNTATIVLVVMSIVLILGMLTAKWSTSPMISELGEYGSLFGIDVDDSYSLFGEFGLVDQFGTLYSEMSSWGSMLGVSESGGNPFGFVSFILIVAVGVLLIGCVVTALGVAFMLMRKPAGSLFCAIGALVLFALSFLHSIVLIVLNSAVADELGGYLTTSVIAPTVFIWLLTLLAVATAVFAFMQKAKNKVQ